MYTEFFGLDEKPFALLPDPRFLYLGSSHQEALAHLLYGIDEGEGFIEVVGQVGTGKTTLCRTLLDRVGHDVDIAFIFNPPRNETDLLIAINREFGLPTGNKSRAELMEDLNELLLKGKAAGRRMILVIDEAQNLSAELLEQVRLLSNLETEREKLLQIVLIGQPELEQNLSRTDLRQLRQRITVRWDLKPFDRNECAEYIEHRLRVAGRRSRKPLFTPASIKALFKASGGIPRLINAIADRALLSSYAAGKDKIEAKAIRDAASELQPKKQPVSRLRLGVGIGFASSVGVLAAAAVLASTFGWLPDLGPRRTRASVAAAPAPLAAETVQPAIFSATAEGSELRSLVPDLVARGTRGTAADALVQVLFLWGYDTPIGDAVDPNQMASVVREVSPLKLLPRLASLEQLASLNLPAVLELEPESGQYRYVALQRLGADGSATISAGERIYVLPANGLYKLWSGRTFFLWTNYDAVPTVGKGMSGSAVRWVQEKLTALEFMRPGDPSGEYDQITEEAIRKFQARFKLEPTGEVGPETLIAIYEALGYGGPKLRDGEIS